MQLETSQLCALAETIWSSMLGLSLTPVDEFPPGHPGEPMVVGCIQITGEWQGALTLQCTGELAKVATSIMFDMPQEETDSSLIQDAVGELTNMLGGNLKSILPGPSSLSMPAVAEGTCFTLGVARAKVVGKAAFDCDGQPMLITVLSEAK